MNEASNVGRLAQYWKGQGLAIAHGVNENQLRDFETHYQVQMPAEFRAYLRKVNGMVQNGSNDCDRNIFAFWPLARIKPIREECPEYAWGHNARRFFVFADYMLWSWAYAIEMSHQASQTGTVILVGGHRPQVVSESFDGFVSLYIADSADLYAKA